MDIRIVDTTLRDGEQKAGIALGINEKLQIARLLDRMGIYQIEAGTPAMGGSERRSILKMAELGLKSRISTWNRMILSDIKESIECGADIIHISVPSSDIQIVSKLDKDRNWVVGNLERCLDFIREKGFEATVGFEDASRADMEFLLQLTRKACEGNATRVRYADTVGILHRQRIFDEIKAIKDSFNIEIEVHTHNDLGMAVSNAISAVKAGAGFVDCTIGGIGERAGNCDYLHFIKAAKGCLKEFDNIDMDNVSLIQKEIMKIIKS